MLVRKRTAAEQADLCVKVRTEFLLTASSENVFKRLHRSFAKAALVRYDISCWFREVNCCVQRLDVASVSCAKAQCLFRSCTHTRTRLLFVHSR